jgi:hypothetical protein
MNHRPTLNAVADAVGAALLLASGLFAYCFGEQSLNTLLSFFE